MKFVTGTISFDFVVDDLPDDETQAKMDALRLLKDAFNLDTHKSKIDIDSLNIELNEPTEYE